MFKEPTQTPPKVNPSLWAGVASPPPWLPPKQKEGLGGPPSRCRGPVGFLLHLILTAGSPDADALRKSATQLGPPAKYNIWNHLTNMKVTFTYK